MACLAAPEALGAAASVFRKKFPAKWRFGWPNTRISGGMVALGVEHVAYGEIVPRANS